MLPDFPSLKGRLMDRHIIEIRAKIDAQMPIVSKIRSVRFHEGNSFSVERDDGVIESQGFIDVRSPIQISANLEFKETVQNLREETEKLALDFASQLEKLFFDRFRETTESVGNAMDMKGAPFTAETHLDMLERVELDFDRFGLPIYPIQVCHPVMAETIQKELARFRTESRLRERPKLSSSRNKRNGVIERVVEDWLHNVNELGYEDSFAHALISEGHGIVHKQEHGQLELGRDLITKDPTGVYHAYQLKGGNIAQGKWTELISQIEMTVSSPIMHPNVPADADFIPYLVTNGTLTDPVRADIVNRNRKWKTQYNRELKVILYDDLLDKFLKIPSSFLPTKPRDFQLFLTLYLADKHEPLRCEEFSQFLLSLTPEAPVKAAELRRLLAAITIVADYVISEYEKAENYFSAAQAWGLLLFHLLRVCEPHPQSADWTASVDLIISSIEKNIRLLIDETLASTNVMSGNPFVDEHVWPYRISTLIGVFSAHMVSRRLAKSRLEDENDLYGWISRFLFDFKLWGEAAAPALFMASQCFCLRGAELAGVSTAIRAIETITTENGAKAKVGLPDPYFDAEDVMKVQLFGEDIYGEKVTFAGRSHSIRQFVELIVRRNWPRMLDERWYSISGIDSAEFQPTSPVDAYLWRSKEGSNNSRRWSRPHSWRALAAEAVSAPEDSLLIDTKYVHLLPYYFLFLPHRFTISRARLMDVTLLLRLEQ